jgi:hypothetical protein
MYERFLKPEDAYECFEKAYEYYDKIELKQHQAYLLLKISRKYENRQIGKGVELLHKSIDFANISNYQRLLPFCYEELFNKYVEAQSFDLAYKILPKVDSVFYKQVRTIGSLAQVFEYKNRRLDADNILQYGWSLTSNKVDSSAMYYNMSRYYHMRRQFSKSLDNYNKGLKLQLDIALQSIHNPIPEIEKDYLTNKIIHQKRREDRKKLVLILSFLVIAVLSIFIALYVYIQKRRELMHKNSLISQYLLSVESLHSELAERDEKLKEVSSEIFGEAFKTINSLCCTYFEYSDNPKQQSAILNHVKGLIGNISSKSYLIQLEEQINGCYDNILQKLKSDFPSMLDNEYRLFCYLSAGFTTQAICLFLNCNTNAVYNRISRLRKKIKDSSSVNKEQFLKYL